MSNIGDIIEEEFDRLVKYGRTALDSIAPADREEIRDSLRECVQQRLLPRPIQGMPCTEPGFVDLCFAESVRTSIGESLGLDPDAITRVQYNGQEARMRVFYASSSDTEQVIEVVGN